MVRRILFLLTLCFGLNQLMAQAPAGYYDKIDGKSRAEIKTALHNILRTHASMGYDSFTAQFWGDVYYKKADWHPSGYYWDMYSNNQRTEYNGTNMSREHCMPCSWWKADSDGYGDAYSDLLNLYPSDASANGQKSNNPLGEVGSADYDNGVVKTGRNAYPGYTGKAFEPADEYKGDFARTYFYMVTCYEDYANRWTGGGTTSMLKNETYPVFQDWALNMLLEWHKNDPVSQKEIDRNNTVFSMQYNRNPFIDHPELIDYIWGDITAQYTVTNKATAPALITPTIQSELNFGSRTKSDRDIYVKSVKLTQNISIELISGDVSMFSIDAAALTSANANNGTMIHARYLATVDGTHTATLRFSSSEIGQIDMVLTGSYSSAPSKVDPVTPSEDMDVMIFYTGPWNKAQLPSNFSTTAASNPYANGDLAFKKTGENLVVTFTEEPDIMQFAAYQNGNWGENVNHLYVYESTDAKTWGSAIADFDNTQVTTSYFNTPEIPLRAETRAIKIEYFKVGQNVGINNLIVTRTIPVGVGLENAEDAIRVYAYNGELHIRHAESGLTIQVYDILGKNVYQGVTSSSDESIQLTTKGILVVRIGSKVFKIKN